MECRWCTDVSLSGCRDVWKRAQAEALLLKANNSPISFAAMDQMLKLFGWIRKQIESRVLNGCPFWCQLCVSLSFWYSVSDVENDTDMSDVGFVRYSSNGITNPLCMILTVWSSCVHFSARKWSGSSLQQKALGRMWSMSRSDGTDYGVAGTEWNKQPFGQNWASSRLDRTERNKQPFARNGIRSALYRISSGNCQLLSSWDCASNDLRWSTECLSCSLARPCLPRLSMMLLWGDGVGFVFLSVSRQLERDSWGVGRHSC